MHHSINILLWITYTLFALLYVHVNAQDPGFCGDPFEAGCCTDCPPPQCLDLEFGHCNEFCGCYFNFTTESCLDARCPTQPPYELSQSVYNNCTVVGDPGCCTHCGIEVCELKNFTGLCNHGCGCYANGIGNCVDVTCTSNPTDNPSKLPTKPATKPPSKLPSKSPSKLPSTLQFTQILTGTIVFSGHFSDFEQYAADQYISVFELAEQMIYHMLQESVYLVDPERIMDFIIIVIERVFQSSIGIEFSITGDESIIDAADNVFQDAIDNNIEISVGTLTLTPLSVKTETATATATTTTPSESPGKSPGKSPGISPSKLLNNNSESSSSEGSDSVDTHTANQISDLSDQNIMKRNDEMDLTIYISNKTFMLVTCILIGMFIIIGLYAYYVNYKKY